MVKNHLKRIAAPKTWNIDRKSSKYTVKAYPSGHPMEHGMPLSLAMRELIKVARTAKEAKRIINTKDVFVDRRKRTEERFLVGLMDIVEFPQLEEQYRVLLDAKGRLTAVKADKKEAATKLCRLESKTKVSGNRTQLNLSDGRNILVDKDTYKAGDTLQLLLPDQKVQDHLKLEKGSLVLLIGGKHSGTIAKMEEISGNKIMIKTSKNQKFETLKKHAFVVGKEKPALDSIKQLMK
ncbi:30S ribosomal protein S4e [Candidatus Woesearchaeota archaeon]|nr:30S ribosomal protein S4e [Candidatus Woesearchaeota archaeon]